MSSPYLIQPLESFVCIMPRDSWYLSWAILSPSTDESKQCGPESQALIPCPARPVLAAMCTREVSPRLSSVSQQFLGILGMCPHLPWSQLGSHCSYGSGGNMGLLDGVLRRISLLSAGLPLPGWGGVLMSRGWEGHFRWGAGSLLLAGKA